MLFADRLWCLRLLPGAQQVSRRRLLPVSEQEFALLIRHSTDHGILSAAFGTGGLAVNLDEAPWALGLVRQWRGYYFMDGGGI